MSIVACEPTVYKNLPGFRLVTVGVCEATVDYLCRSGPAESFCIKISGIELSARSVKRQQYY